MSIFNLKTDVTQLESVNQGISKLQYNELSATRDVTSTNFQNGVISFKWNTSGDNHWIPSRSYLRMRCKLTAGDGNQLGRAASIAPSMNLGNNIWSSCEFRIADKTVSKIPDHVAQVAALKYRTEKSKSWLENVGRSTNFTDHSHQYRVDQVSVYEADSLVDLPASDFEVIWQPPLSIFDIDHALPAGSYSLELNPISTNFESRAISAETPGAPIHGDAGTFKFTVENIHFYLCQVSGPRFDTGSYLLDLNNLRCQTDTITSTSYHQKNFDIEKSTNAVTIAYQDGRINSDPRLNPGMFHSHQDVLTANLTQEETQLERFNIQYAGQTIPSPDLLVDLDTGKNHLVTAYQSVVLNNSHYFSLSPAESLDDWRERGLYLHYQVPRDGTDMSTRIVVNQQFNSNAAITNMKLLLFDHYKSAAKITVSEGRVMDVIIENM